VQEHTEAAAKAAEETAADYRHLAESKQALAAERARCAELEEAVQVTNEGSRGLPPFPASPSLPYLPACLSAFLPGRSLTHVEHLHPFLRRT